MRETPRCGAKTRSGMSCRAPAVRGKARCRMHGGAKGSGAPQRNTNALKHGKYTASNIERGQRLKHLLKEIDKL
ncbi:MAG: HGGxSTG domain-containing protein [Pseudomonadota bacterium]